MWASPGIGPAPRAAATAAELDREVAAIGKAITDRQDSSVRQAAERLLWPVPGYPEVTSAFGTRMHPVLRVARLHTGVDIGAPEGAPAVAAAAGKVVLVAEFQAYGRVVAIDHGGGLATVYAHLSAVSVQEGEAVRLGDQIGRVGQTGQVTGPHLHFEVRRDGEPVDTTPFLTFF